MALGRPLGNEPNGTKDLGQWLFLLHRSLSSRWSMAPTSLERFAFQKGDRVRWSKADEDIPEGSIGQARNHKPAVLLARRCLRASSFGGGEGAS